MSNSFTSEDNLKASMPLKNKEPNKTLISTGIPQRKTFLSDVVQKVTSTARGHNRFSRSVSFLSDSLKSASEGKTPSRAETRNVHHRQCHEEMIISTPGNTDRRSSVRFAEPSPRPQRQSFGITQHQLMKPINVLPPPRSKALHFLSPEATHTLPKSILKKPLSVKEEADAQYAHSASGIELDSKHCPQTRAPAAESQLMSPDSFPPKASEHQGESSEVDVFGPISSRRQGLPRWVEIPKSSANDFGRSTQAGISRFSSQPQLHKANLRQRQSRIPTPETRGYNIRYSNKRSELGNRDHRQGLSVLKTNKQSNEDFEESRRSLLSPTITPSNTIRSRIPTPVRLVRGSSSFNKLVCGSRVPSGASSPPVQQVRLHQRQLVYQAKTPETSMRHASSNRSSPFSATGKENDRSKHSSPMASISEGTDSTDSIDSYLDYSVLSRAVQWAEKACRSSPIKSLERDGANDDKVETDLVACRIHQITKAESTTWWLGRFNSISDRLRTDELIIKTKQAAELGAGDLRVNKDVFARDHPADTGMFDEETRCLAACSELETLCTTQGARDSFADFKLAYLNRLKKTETKEAKRAQAGRMKADMDAALKKQDQKHKQRLMALKNKERQEQQEIHRQQQLLQQKKRKATVGLEQDSGNAGEIKGKVNVFERLGLGRRKLSKGST